MDSYEDIGQLLTAARRQIRISADEAGQRLHIRTRYIEALESGKLEAIPGLAYARGYLHSYANFLSLDAVELVRRFELVEEGLARKSLSLPQVFNKEKAPSSQIIWGSGLAALLMYVLWSLIVKPAGAPISLVEAMPKRFAPIETQEVACLRPKEPLYPPCTLQEPQFSLLPLSRKHHSIMELAGH